MKKVLIFLVVLIAVPAMAVTVTVTATDNADGTATITTITDGNLPRGFGLDISIDAGTITAVTPTSGGEYRIFPGQIYVVDGNVIDYNTPYPAGSLGSSTVTVEMASLYTDDIAYEFVPDYGYGMEPSTTETLMIVTTSDCGNLTITENAARGGVVMEDVDEAPTVVFNGVEITGCGGCDCLGDLADIIAQPPGDGSVVDFGDINYLISQLAANGWAPFDIIAGRPDLACADVADVIAQPPGDGQWVDFGDINYLIGKFQANGWADLGCGPW